MIRTTLIFLLVVMLFSDRMAHIPRVTPRSELDDAGRFLDISELLHSPGAVPKAVVVPKSSKVTGTTRTVISHRCVLSAGKDGEHKLPKVEKHP